MEMIATLAAAVKNGRSDLASASFAFSNSRSAPFGHPACSTACGVDGDRRPVARPLVVEAQQPRRSCTIASKAPAAIQRRAR